MEQIRADAQLDQVQPARVDVELVAGDEIPSTELRVIDTPGHTLGHICYLDTKLGVLFLGDSAANFGQLTVGGVVNEDSELARKSFEGIAELDFDVAVFGHGTPLVGRASAEFRKVVERVSFSG